MSLNRRLRQIIMKMLLPLVFCFLLILLIFVYYEAKYSRITHNVNISSTFNIDFKKAVDLKMYYYCVGSKQQTTLPISDVEEAVNLADSLKKTTYRKESKRTLQNILNYCTNLKEKMYLISNTHNYDSKMQQLDNNIYILTRLIQGKINDYIYYEAGYMADLKQKINQYIQIVIISTFIFVIGISVYLFRYGLRFSKSITEPIGKLCENVKQVGKGEFTIPNIKSNYKEIDELNLGIQNMSQKISMLFESIKREEEERHRVELQLLQAQINPHFLYNTLDTIVWLVEAEKSELAVDMLTNLSVFFRTILSKGKDIIRLEEEIRHTKSYLDIQQIRYQDILEYDINLPSELNNLLIPKLSLQPLVENALYHGVKEKRGKSKIKISCTKCENDIFLIVSDNGIGIKKEKLKSILNSLESYSMEKSEQVGFGLLAVNERIKLYFGKNYGVSISSKYGQGTVAKVHICKKIN